MRKLAGNAALVMTGDVAARAIGFVTSVHVAREIGREGFGVVTVGIAFLSYAILVADLGLGTLGVREKASGPEQRRFSDGEILTSRLLLSLLVLLVAQAVALVLYQDQRTWSVVAIYLLALIPISLWIDWYHQGEERFLPVAVARTINAAIALVATLLLVHAPEDLPFVPIAFGLGFVAGALVLHTMRSRRESLLPHSFSFSRCRKVIAAGATIGVGGILAQSVQNLPPLILGWYSLQMAGDFGAAMKIAFVVLMLDRVLGMLYLPAITGFWQRDRTYAAALLSTAAHVVVVAAFLVATLTTLGAGRIVALVFGAEYAGAAEILAILSWFIAATLINSILSFGLIGVGAERRYLRAMMVGTTGMVVLTLVLVNIDGARGAALAMAIGESLIALLAWRELRGITKITLLRPVVVSAIVSGTLLYVCHIFSFDSIWRLPVVSAIYLPLAIVGSGIWPRREVGAE